jgi:hypothetical protein
MKTDWRRSKAVHRRWRRDQNLSAAHEIFISERILQSNQQFPISYDNVTVKQTLHACDHRSCLFQQDWSKGKQSNLFENIFFPKNRFCIMLSWVCGGKLNFPHAMIRYRRSVYRPIYFRQARRGKIIIELTGVLLSEGIIRQLKQR